MNAREMLARWIEGLRNPNQKQAFGVYHQVDLQSGEISCCALGVLHDLYLANTRTIIDGDTPDTAIGVYGLKELQRLWDSIGLTFDERRQITIANDDYQLSLSKIADLIEKKILPARKLAEEY